MKTFEDALDVKTYGFNVANIGRKYEMREGGSLLGVATVGKGKAIWKWYSDRWFQRDGSVEDLQKWVARRKVELKSIA